MRTVIDSPGCVAVGAAQVDAIGGTRFDDGAGGDNEVQRTMLEIVNQLDGFDARGNIKVRAHDSAGVRRLCVSPLTVVARGTGAGAHGDEPSRHAGPRADSTWSH